MRRTLLMLAVAGTFVAAGCDGGAGASPPADAAAFYERLERALTREGAVAHVTIATSGSVDANPYATQEELWLDVAAGRGRGELTTGFATSGATRAQVRIVDGRALYAAAEGAAVARVEAPTCRGAPTAVVAMVLGCHGHLESATVTVEASSFDGRETVALVAEGTAPRSEEVRGFRDALHLDAETMLPVGRTSAGSYDFGGVHAFDTTSAITVEFERADALAEGFLEPAAPGSVEGGLAEKLMRAAGAVGLRWPRTRLDVSGRPALELATVFAGDDATQPWTGARVTLGYRRADDAFGEPVVFVHAWRRDEWRGARGLAYRETGDAVVEVEAAEGSGYEAAEEALLGQLIP